MSDQDSKQPSSQGSNRQVRPRRNLPMILLLLGLVLIGSLIVGTNRPSVKKFETLSDIQNVIDKNLVNSVTIVDGTRVRGRFRDVPNNPYKEKEFELPYAGRPENSPLTAKLQDDWDKQLKANGFGLRYERSDAGFMAGFLSFLPWLILMLLFWLLIFRQMRSMGGSGGVMQFGRSRARMHVKEQSNVSFDDVAGIEEALEEVEEVVAFLKSPQKFKKIGARIPRGILLVGPPGCGKTLLAKAIAGEAGVPFFSVSGSDFVEMFVGVGASRVRDLFKQARESSPCIIFLDEIDAVGRRRGAGVGGGHDEREQTLNQILVEMDGFDTDQGIILLAATNRPDVLDPALLRPGRFDRNIVITLPDLPGREKILRVHSRKVKMDAEVDLARVARATPGFSGAELEALINEGALMAVTAGRDAVTLLDLEEARDKIRFGRSRKSMAMTEDEKKLTAYHEAGHALVTVLQEKSDPLHKVTIIPRGMALGVTMSLPERDRLSMSKKEMLARLRVCYGGRLAEELICGDVTNGAQNDIEQATELARLMVTKWGMSDKVGPISLAEGEQHLFLGREVTRTLDHSEETSRLIDAEIKALLVSAHEDCRTMLQEHMDDLHKIAQGLLLYETLTGEEVKTLLAGTSVEDLRPTPETMPDETMPDETVPTDEPAPAIREYERKPETDGGRPTEGFAY